MVKELHAALFITVINSVPNLWLFDLNQLAKPARGRSRRIAGPVLDLGVLQSAIVSGQLTAEGVWPATRRSRNSLEDYQWNYKDVLNIFRCLLAGDYKNSEWCDIDGDRTVPCDVYTICYDEVRCQRNPGGIEIYLKFSIDDEGTLTLVLVQSHFS